MTRFLSTLYRLKMSVLRFRWWWLALFGETRPTREAVPASKRIPRATYVECEDMKYLPTERQIYSRLILETWIPVGAEEIRADLARRREAFTDENVPVTFHRN